MPGIKSIEKSKLKTVNTVKVTETQINLEVNPPLDQPSETVATPDNNQPSIEPQPYIVDEFAMKIWFLTIFMKLILLIKKETKKYLFKLLHIETLN